MSEGLSGKRKLDSVEEERDLGVVIRSDLKSVILCNKLAATARRVIRMVRRQFKRLDTQLSDYNSRHKSVRTWILMYPSLVSTSPHYSTKNVQKAA